MGLVVVVTALPARLAAVPFTDVTAQWGVVANLLAGSLVGAWVGATWATRMRSATLYRVLAVLLVFIAAALVASHLGPVGTLDLPPVVRVGAGLVKRTLLGGVLLGGVPPAVIIPLLVTLLLASSVKVWRHQ